MNSLHRRFLKQAVTYVMTLMLGLTMICQTTAFAQVETGQITGTVTDPQAAVVAGANVTVTNTGTGATRTTTTSGEGYFIVPSLQPGNYEVTVEGSGFATRKLTVQVTVGTRTTLNVELAVAGVEGESVDVVANEGGVQVNTENQTLSTVVSQKQIRELPTITRNPYALVQLAGTAVNIDPEAQDPGTTASDRGAGFNINGQRSASTNVQLDGADNNDTYSSDIGNAVPLDSVQEFSVLSNNFSAEFGRAGGGIVNVATKSGTNEFHGTVYEFNRLSRLASASANLNAQFDPQKKGVFTRNQFGYSIGGPAIKDKLVFFNSTEWIRVRSFDTAIAWVLTPEFLAQADPNVQQVFGRESLVAPTTQILTRADVNNIVGVGNASSAFNQLPANLPVFGRVFYSVPADAGGGLPQNQYQTVSRVDWNLSDKTQIYGRYAYQRTDFFDGTNSFSPYNGYNTGILVRNHNFLVSATHVWSDNFITQSKFAYSRIVGDQPLSDTGVAPSYYLVQGIGTQLLNDLVALPGYLPFNPGAAIPAGGPANNYQFYQDQTWTVGDHSMRFGGVYLRIHDDHFFGAFQNAVVELGTAGNVEGGLNALLNGTAARFRVAIDAQGKQPLQQITLPAQEPSFLRNNRYNEGALYINDTWKIHPRLTVNLGLRWDYFGVQHNTDKSLDANFVKGPGATEIEQIRNGRTYITPESPVGGLWYKDLNNFGPRVGIAWDVFGDGKTSLRGGYGISYERNFGNVTFNVIQNAPVQAVIDLRGLASFPTSNLGPVAGGSGPVTLPRASLRYVDENIRNAYAHFWSASIDREFLGNLVGSIEYSGSKGVKLYSLEDVNGPFSALAYNQPFDPATNGAAFLHPFYSSINRRSNSGFSNYNSMTASVQSRQIQSLGLSFLAKYTWSHAIDNLSSTFSDGGSLLNLGLLDPFNPELDRGNADYDIRHRFITSGIWELPFARDTEGVAKHVLDGWSLTWIFNARTGAPFTIFDCTNGFFRCNRLLQAGPIDIDGQGDARAVSGVANQYTYIDLTNQLSQVGTYFEPNSGVADYGPYPSNMTARNAFRRPGYWNLDGGIYKSISLTETMGLQLRAEFYNMFNHPNLFLNDQGTAIDISSTPQITAYKEGRRQIQLAVKFIF